MKKLEPQLNSSNTSNFDKGQQPTHPSKKSQGYHSRVSRSPDYRRTFKIQIFKKKPFFNFVFQEGEKGHSWIVADKDILLENPKTYWANNKLSNNVPIVFGKIF